MDFAQWILFAVQLLAGTGVFLTGVYLLTSNIEQLATGKIKDLFARTANRRLVNMGIGAATTALIQSSGVTTVLIVGFVNVGVMNLYQAAAMIMGANIGTTVTAQVAALSAFPITSYIQGFVFLGIMMNLVCKKESLQKTGLVIAGLSLIFVGLALMSDGMKAHRDVIQTVFETVTNPGILFLLGIVVTALVQSSSATTSVIIAMSVAGLTVGTGGNEILYIILGTNIGSCATALMSALSAGENAKRAGLIHLMFNTFGAGIFFVVLLCWPGFMRDTFGRWFASAATQVAMFHTFFNVFCTMIFLPFCGVFVKIAQKVIHKEEEEPAETYLDERMLTSASLAIVQIEKELVLLSDKAMQAFRSAYCAFKNKDKEKLGPAHRQIEQANDICQSIVNYLIRLSAQSKLSEEKKISDLHNNAGDMMRIAEIADNFTKYAKNTMEKNLEFSEKVLEEIDEMVDCVEQLYRLTRSALLERNAALLPQIDEQENKVDAMRKQLINRHIERLNAGICKPECSGVLINLVSNLERLGDHLTYIAYTIGNE